MAIPRRSAATCPQEEGQMDVRRVVTGHDANGKAVFVSEERVAPTTPALLGGFTVHKLWGADEPPRLPDDGSLPSYTSYFPPVGGIRFSFVTFPPHFPPDPDAGFGEDLDIDAAVAELDDLFPGLAQHMEPGGAGMHTSATVDIGVVLAGEVVLELDDGATVTLRAGDTVVQNGTRHRWSNPGDVPVVLVGYEWGVSHERVTGSGPERRLA
jgi:mannose-6-phosphate isomerase-like protein (cupin superfamily)